MPVVVLGADDGVGRDLVEALRPSGSEVRAVVSTRAAQRALVPLGVRTACLPDLDDVDVLAAVMTGAHTVVHAAGDEPADTLRLVQEAADRAGVVRVLVVTGRPLPDAVAPGPGAVAQLLAADARA